jgi:DNA-binding XRE family transcriptional regulator
MRVIETDRDMARSKDSRKTIKELREALKLTQFQLSVKSGVNLSTVVYAEQLKRMPDIDNAIKIAQALGVHVEDIIWKTRGK